MRFFWSWILRELKNKPQFAVLLLANFVISLSSFFLLNNFRSVYHQSLLSQAQSILGADITISARRFIDDDEKNLFSHEIAKFGVETQTSSLEFLSMVNTPGDLTKLVQVRGVDARYPIYGDLTTNESVSTNQLQEGPFTIVYEEVLTELGLQVGDEIFLGDHKLKIIGTVKEDSSQSNRLGSLAPRFFVGRNQLVHTGLLQRGTTLNETLYYKLSRTPTEDDSNRILKKFTDTAIQVIVPSQASKDAARGLDYLLDYLSLIGLVALLMSGLGTFFLSRTFIQEKIKDIGLLAALGLSHGRIKRLFVGYFILLILTASVLSLLATFAIQPFLVKIVNTLLNYQLLPQIDPWSVGGLIFVALAVGLIVLMPAIQSIESVDITGLLRGELQKDITLSKSKYVYLLGGSIFFYALSVIQTRSYVTANLFFLSLFSISVLCLLLTWLPLRWALRIQDPRRWKLKWTIRSLYRKPIATYVTLISLSTAFFLTAFVPLLAYKLKSDLDPKSSQQKPALFLFDIQEDQIESLKEIANKTGTSVESIAPLIRARILTVNDQAFVKEVKKSGPETKESEIESRFRNRGFNLSVRDSLYPSEELISGQSFLEAKSSYPKVSVEKKFAERLGWKLGDILKFDVQGKEVAGQIINFRKVNWTSFEPNFFIIFESGVLDSIQKTYLANIKSPNESGVKIFQKSLIRDLPNITAVDLKRALFSFMKTWNQIEQALKVTSVITLIAGFIVVFSIIILGKSHRVRDRILLSFLGVSDLNLRYLGFIEASLFGVWSLMLGVGLSLITVEMVFKYILK